jgi:hypothetical protein
LLRLKDNGFTSNKRKSLADLFPIKTSACSPAPIATTLSGSISVRGGFSKKDSTALRIMGMRVEPPTKTILSISSFDKEASRSTRRQAFIILLM